MIEWDWKYEIFCLRILIGYIDFTGGCFRGNLLGDYIHCGHLFQNHPSELS